MKKLSGVLLFLSVAILAVNLAAVKCFADGQQGTTDGFGEVLSVDREIIISNEKDDIFIPINETIKQ